MKKVTVKKDELLASLRANREAHRAIFEEACDGYQAEAIRIIEEHLTKIRAGKRVTVWISLDEPADHTKDYDRVIKMVEMSTVEELELDANEFSQYVMDDWTWKRQFLTSNSTYSGTAAAQLQ